MHTAPQQASVVSIPDISPGRDSRFCSIMLSQGDVITPPVAELFLHGQRNDGPPAKVIIWQGVTAPAQNFAEDVTALFRIITAEPDFRLNGPGVQLAIRSHQAGDLHIFRPGDVQYDERIQRAFQTFDKIPLLRIDCERNSSMITFATVETGGGREFTLGIEEPYQFTPEVIRWFLEKCPTARAIVGEAPFSDQVVASLSAQLNSERITLSETSDR